MAAMNDSGPRPEAARQAQLDARFGAEAGFWNDLYAAGGVLATVHRYRTALALRWIDELDLPAAAPALEVGCGAGLLSVALAERGLDLEATDPVQAMLDLAQGSHCSLGPHAATGNDISIVLLFASATA